MTKPDDVSQWAWDDAIRSYFGISESDPEPETVPIFRASVTRIARRLDAAHAAGKAEQREADAQIASTYPDRDPAEDGNGYWAAGEIAAAIRDADKSNQGRVPVKG